MTPLPERNWVWSPQGAINMHMPERWGYVHFSPGTPRRQWTSSVFEDDPNERVKWALRRVYYRQRNARARTGAYAATLDELGVSDIRVDGLEFKPALYATPSLYEVVAPGFGGRHRPHRPGRAGVGDAVDGSRLAARFSAELAALSRWVRIAASAEPKKRAASSEPRD